MRVALVLGSGGARGYAHLGVLAELRARGDEVVAISGASIGALVGAFAAVGREDELAQWTLGLSQRKLWQLLDPVLRGSGAIRGAKVLAALTDLLGEHTIEGLPIPYTAVAVDLTTQREVWFQSGPVLDAVRASMAIPGALTPVVIGQRVLVDGGLLNPVPVEPVLAANADYTLAVNLTGPDLVTPAEPHRRWISATGPPASSATEVLFSSWETTQAATARFRMATNPPDVVVTVPLRSCRTMDFHRAADMIHLGRYLTRAALEATGR